MTATVTREAIAAAITSAVSGLTPTVFVSDQPLRDTDMLRPWAISVETVGRDLWQTRYQVTIYVTLEDLDPMARIDQLASVVRTHLMSALSASYLINDTQGIGVVEGAGAYAANFTVDVLESEDPGTPFPSPLASYLHTQSTPATTWTINHNLGRRPTVVAVTTVGWLEVQCEVEHVSSNQTMCRFSVPFQGYARLV